MFYQQNVVWKGCEIVLLAGFSRRDCRLCVCACVRVGYVQVAVGVDDSGGGEGEVERIWLCP